MEAIFPVPMSRKWHFLYLLGAAITAGLTAWSFKVGYTWSGICLLVVMVPLGILYWYTLFLTPARATVVLAAEAMQVTAAGFAAVEIPYAAVERAFDVDLREPADPQLALVGVKKGMKFGAYRLGVFTMASGKEALVAACRRNALALRTAEGFVFLATTRQQALKDALAARGVPV